MPLLEHLANEEFAAGVADVVLSEMGLSKMPHELSKCLTMEILSLAQNNIREVDEECLKACKLTLRMFDMSHNALHQVLFLPRMDFLETLNLSHNEITTLPALHGVSPCLVHVDVSHNKLVDVSVFDNLSLLQTLDVAHNELNAVKLISLPKLTVLDASFNRLETAELTQCGDLKELILTQNQLHALPSFLARAHLLETLRLSHNSIESVGPELSGCTNLRFLDLTENLVGTLPASLSALHRLQDLTMVGNRLQEVPPVVWTWPRLVSLDLSHNQIRGDGEAPSPPAAACRDTLVDLHISYNHLSSLPNALHPCVALRTLDASHNRIERLPAFLAQCKDLEHLLLSHNLITNIPIDAIAAATNLIEMDVDSNELTTLPMIPYPMSLRSVYVSNNRLGPLDVQRFLDATSTITLTECVTAPQRDPGRKSKRWKALDSAHGTLQQLMGRIGQEVRPVGDLGPLGIAKVPYNTFTTRTSSQR